MDPFTNPFAPGAGARPPALVGRDRVLESAEVALHRIQRGRPEKSQMLLGLRGVGKTVLLNRISEIADQIGYKTIFVEAPEGQRLGEYLAPALKGALLSFSKVEMARDYSARAFGALRGFASTLKISIGEIGFEVKEPNRADSGNLEVDLPELLVSVGYAAQSAKSSLAILIDEVQYLGEEDLRALIVSMHRISQIGLPVILFGAGLPQVAGLSGAAKSYAERLFDYPEIGPLGHLSATAAILDPIKSEGADIDAEALEAIVSETQGYPYFLQEWGKHAWNQAAGPTVTLADVHAASSTAMAALDQSFFRVRFDRLTPREQQYLRAMAELGPGPHRSGDIAKMLRKDVQKLGPLRSGLIKKGMIWSPNHGDTAFTVPLFDDFMRREMPDWPPP